MLKEDTAAQYSETTGAQADLGAEINRLAMSTLAIEAGLVGAWTVARIAGALFFSGGPVALFQA